MAADARETNLLASCIVAGAELDPWEMWAYLLSRGLLRDDPGDRDAFLEVIAEEWDRDAPDLGASARQAAAALRRSDLALDAAERPDPDGGSARSMFETFDRRRREGRSRFRPLLEAAWEGVSAPSEHVDWSFSLSPAYPSSWPPSPEGRLVYYAKARGRDRRCPDAWHRAPVWARVETVRDGSATPRVVLEHSEVAPEKRPAIVIPRTTTHEILVRELESAMWETFELLLTTPALPDEDAPETRYLRECYGLSGGSPRIRERHAAFFRWLEA